jgi:hypothetical protein
MESLLSTAMCLSFSLPISCICYGASFMNTDKYLYKILYGLDVLEFLYLLIVMTSMILKESTLQRCKTLGCMIIDTSKVYSCSLSVSFFRKNGAWQRGFQWKRFCGMIHCNIDREISKVIFYDIFTVQHFYLHLPLVVNKSENS